MIFSRQLGCLVFFVTTVSGAAGCNPSAFFSKQESSNFKGEVQSPDDANALSAYKLTKPIAGIDGVIFSLDMTIGNIQKNRDIVLQCFYFAAATDPSSKTELKLSNTEIPKGSESIASVQRAEGLHKVWLEREEITAMARERSGQGAVGLLTKGSLAAMAFNIQLAPALPIGFAVLGGALATYDFSQKDRSSQLNRFNWFFNLLRGIQTSTLGAGAGALTGAVVSFALPWGLLGLTFSDLNRALTNEIVVRILNDQGNTDWLPAFGVRGAVIKSFRDVLTEADYKKPYFFVDKKSLPCPSPNEIADALVNPQYSLDMSKLYRK